MYELWSIVYDSLSIYEIRITNNRQLIFDIPEHSVNKTHNCLNRVSFSSHVQVTLVKHSRCEISYFKQQLKRDYF